MKVIPFSKVFSIGTVYRAETNKSFIVRRVGTNSTTRTRIIVEGRVCGEFIYNFAPLTCTSSNSLYPFELNDLYIVIPKGARFEFSGETGKYVKLEGEILIHEYGEDLPAEFKSRYENQSKEYYTFLQGTYTSAAAATIPSGKVATVLDFTCPAGREYLLNSIFLAEASTTAGTIPRELLAHQILINDSPLDILDSTMGPFGIATIQTPNPPRADLNFFEYTLENMPIQLREGTNLKVVLINNGDAKTLASGETLNSNVIIVARYKIL